MSSLSDNIKHLRKLKGWTQNDLAEKIDIKRSLLGAYEEGRADPRLNNLSKLSRLFRLTVDTLMHKDLTDKNLEQIERLGGGKAGNSQVLAITVDALDEEYIDLIPQKASAGYLNGYADPQYLEDLPKFRLPNLPKSGTYRAFEINGDSMLPIKPGTIIIGRYLSDFSELKNGQCYVILSEQEGVVFKRVFDYTQEHGQLFLVSDHKTYPPYKIDASDVLEIWEAKAYLSMEFPNYGEDDMSFEKLKNIVLDLQREIIQLKG